MIGAARPARKIRRHQQSVLLVAPENGIYRVMATETGSIPAGKGERGTGVSAPLEPIPEAETLLLRMFAT